MLLTVAVIGPAHALKGEVRLEIRTDDPEGRLAPGTVLPVEAPRDHPGPTVDHLTVARLRFDGTRWFAAFEQAADRTAAEALRGLRLMVDTADRDADGPEDAGGENDAWYAHELIGLRAVRRLPDGAAETLGEVVDLERGVAQDRIVVRTGSGRDVAVPFVAALVPEVDVEAGTVTLDPPGGLFPGLGAAEGALP